MQISIASIGDIVTDPVTGRRLSVPEKHEQTVELAVAAESAGLHGIHVGEHHGTAYAYSSPPVILGAIAQRTSTLRLGTGVALLANLDPVRVAEDYATVDILSRGRVEIVGGRGGFFPAIYEMFGQSIDESQEMFDENLRLLLKIWTESPVYWHGKYRTELTGQHVVPEPVQRPHPPVWIGAGFSPASTALCAELGLPLMLPVVTFQPARTWAAPAARFREQWAEAGRSEPCRVGAVVHAHVARTSQLARQRWAPRYGAYFDWATQILAGPGHARPSFMAEFDYDVIAGPEGCAVAGSPAEVVDKLSWLAELLGGLDTVLLSVDVGGLPRAEMLDAVELIGAEVLPALR